MFEEFFRVVVTAPLSSRDRAETFAAVLGVIRQRWRLVRGDILYRVRPKLVALGVPDRLLRRQSPGQRQPRSTEGGRLRDLSGVCDLIRSRRNGELLSR